MARELRAAGFDSGLTPVLDCRTDPGSVVVGDRAYAEDPETVAACGAAFVRAALAEGLIPVAKHFPGHGRTPLDSHLALPGGGRLARRARADGAGAVPPGPRGRMPRGAWWPTCATRRSTRSGPRRCRPASSRVSSARELDFGGLVLSDDLEMAAVRSRVGRRRRGRAVPHGGRRSRPRLPRGRDARRRRSRPSGRRSRAAALTPEAARAARGRRAALRRWVERTRPRPGPATSSAAPSTGTSWRRSSRAPAPPGHGAP